MAAADDAEGSTYEETDRDELCSSPKTRRRKKKTKKNARKEKKSARKDKEKEEKATTKARKEAEKNKGKEPEESMGTDPEEEAAGSTPSVLRTGRFSNAGSTPGKKVAVQIRTKDPNRDHKFKDNFIEALVKLTDPKRRHVEFTMKCRGLHTEMQKVDEWVWLMPVKKGAKSPVIMLPSELSINQTDLGANISVADNSSFDKKKPWGKNWEDMADED